jgi:hypothetical protein
MAQGDVLQCGTAVKASCATVTCCCRLQQAVRLQWRALPPGQQHRLPAPAGLELCWLYGWGDAHTPAAYRCICNGESCHVMSGHVMSCHVLQEWGLTIFSPLEGPSPICTGLAKGGNLHQCPNTDVMQFHTAQPGQLSTGLLVYVQ